MDVPLEGAAAAFRRKYGPLDRATVSNFRGWDAEEKYLPNCGQTPVTHIGWACLFHVHTGGRLASETSGAGKPPATIVWVRVPHS